MNIPLTNLNGIYAERLCTFSPLVFRLLGIGEEGNFELDKERIR